MISNTRSIVANRLSRKIFVLRNFAVFLAVLVFLPTFCGNFVFADTEIRPVQDAEKSAIPVNRAILGVNQLFYGKDSYGLLKPGSQETWPELVEILRGLGIRSMRYPGGCGGTHAYDWKKSAGFKGGYSGLGLIEFLRLCEEIGAEPILGISAFRGTPEEAAEFVEFLNAPNDGLHPWAKARCELGRSEPYGVRFIEYGNESYHGNHSETPARGITSGEYGRNYLKFRDAMKKVDPNIQLGVVLGPVYWNRGVWKAIGEDFDFGIVHHYHTVRQTDAAEYILNFNAADRLEKEKQKILAVCPEGRRNNLPLALTEFNTNLTQHMHLTAALANAETLFFLCRNPDFFAAQYWQFLNEAFGMVRGEAGDFVKRPNALMFELVSGALQDWVFPTEQTGRIVSVSPLNERVLADGGEEILKDLTPEDLQKNLLSSPRWKPDADRARTSLEFLPNGEMKVEFLTDEAFNFYHVSTWFKVPRWRLAAYRLTAEIRVEGMEDSSGIALELGDGRGYTKTRSVAATECVLSSEWTPVAVDYLPLRDTDSLELKVRRFNGGGRGNAFIRNIRIVPVFPDEFSKPAIGSLLSVSDGGERLGLLLLNRSFEPETVTFDAGSFPFRLSARKDGETAATTESPAKIPAESAGVKVLAQVLTADDPYADNESAAQKVRIAPLAVRVEETVEGSGRKTKLRLTVPPYSLVGVTLEN